jgi:tRNA-Thr(GGU) m(6)t(6)A37 methyltransferase TsaA
VQEDFLVLHGECIAILDGEERQLKRWDLLHCPAGVEHVFVGAGDGPCAVLMVGSRREDAAHYPVNDTAAKYDASVATPTDDPAEAYADWRQEPRRPTENPWPLGGTELLPIGTVESSLTDRASAPKQGDEGAPEAWLVFEEDVAEALDGLAEGDDVLVLTWLDRARRDVLRVHPRGDRANAPQGVFNTRSPDRPNPIGLHRVTVVAVEGRRLRVRDLEALDGTPIVDLKPVLRSIAER